MKGNRSSIPQRIIIGTIVATLFLVVSMTSVPAQTERSVEMGFDDFVVQEQGDDEIIVEYNIQRRDWDRLYRAGVTPRLHLWAAGQDSTDSTVDADFHREVVLDQRRQRILVDTDGETVGLDEVEIFVEGGNESAFIDGVTVADTTGPSLIITVIPEDAAQIPAERRRDIEPPRIAGRDQTSRAEQRLEQRQRQTDERFSPGPSRAEQRLEQRQQQSEQRFTPDSSRTEQRLEQRLERRHDRIPESSEPTIE